MKNRITIQRKYRNKRCVNLDILLFIFVILIASILQTSTGFGFSILATPFLLFIFNPMEAIQINLILSLVISLALITKIKNDIDFVILKRLLIGSAFGLPIGIIIFLLMNIKNLMMAISMVIFLLTLLLIFQFRLAQTKEKT